MSDYWIVVVDDDAISLRAARNLLSEQNMRASCVRSGRDLLTFLEKNEPDLILLDILMPEMDGFETYHLLREFEEKNGRKQTPVIFLTGENGSDIERRGLRMGASDFIRKPFNREILLSRIRNTVRNAKTIEDLKSEASVDALTGFFNKASAGVRLTEICQADDGALILLDLDSFKLVNDVYGHEMGDRVLEAVAAIIRRNTRQEDTLCRIGGDEFIIFMKEAGGKDAITSLSERLNEELIRSCRDIMGEDFDIPIGISSGVVFVPEHGRDYQTLFQYADKALYKVKQNGKHSFCIYDIEKGAERGKKDLEEELRRISRILEERNGGGDGAMVMGRDSFAGIYQYMIRFLQRYRLPAVKILFYLQPNEGCSNDILAEAAMHFENILQGTLRRSDIIVKSRVNYFLIFLPELREEHVGIVLDRILNAWKDCPYERETEAFHAIDIIDFR